MNSYLRTVKCSDNCDRLCPFQLCTYLIAAFDLSTSELQRIAGGRKFLQFCIWNVEILCEASNVIVL